MNYKCKICGMLSKECIICDKCDLVICTKCIGITVIDKEEKSNICIKCVLARNTETIFENQTRCIQCDELVDIQETTPCQFCGDLLCKDCLADILIQECNDVCAIESLDDEDETDMEIVDELLKKSKRWKMFKRC